MAKVWMVRKAGSLNHMFCIEQAIRPPQAEEVRIKVQAIGLNFADIFAIQGLYSATPKSPFIPGLEFAGEVIKVLASSPCKYQLGDAVMGVTRFGAYAEEMNIDPSHLWKLPHNWTYEEGAAFPVQAFTAWYGLVKLGNIQPQQVIVVHSAAGGVGYWALEIIQHKGAVAICTVGNKEKIPFLHERFSIPENRIIIRSKSQFSRQLSDTLHTLNREGIDVVFDAIYGPFFQPAYQRLNPGGRYILYGAAIMMKTGSSPNYLKLAIQYLRRFRPDPLEMISANKTVIGFNLIWLWDQIEELRREFLQMVQVIQRKPHIDHVFSFREMKEGILYLQSGKTKGKVVVVTE